MGFSSRFSTVAVALLSSTLFLQETLSQLVDCQASSSDFDYEVTLGDDFDVRWTVDTDGGTISFEAFTPAAAWISVGFSADGDMIGSDAVIGLPGDDTVVEYDLTGKALNLVVVSDDQEITGGTVAQDDNGTTLTFTRPLTPAASGKQTLSPIPGDETIILFAFGSENELDAHTPDNRGPAQLDLFCGDVAGSESGEPTAAPSTATAAPLAEDETAAPSTPTPSLAPVDGGGDGGEASLMTFSPSGMVEASDPPTEGEDSGEDTTRDTDTDAAFRVNGGLWAAAVTVATAVLGAAMAV